MSHYKDPYQPTSIMESNKGFFRGSPGSLFSFVASFPTTTRCWCARELPFHMSWWLWFEELQNGRGAGVSWWSWWCCWQKVICLFLTWYVNKYLIYIWHVDTIYDLYIYVYTRSIYIHLVSNVVKLATASTVWTMQPAFPRIRLRDSSVGKNDRLKVVKVD